MPIGIKDLQKFPKLQWGEEPSERWLGLCNQLQDYNPPKVTLAVKHLDRKWEMVSAYQKSVRRGMTEMALKLAGGWLSFPNTELRYFWRRVATTAAEDIGYADPELMNFVIACTMVYGGVKTNPAQMHHCWCFLTEQMCAGPKSRITCQLSIIESLVRKGVYPPDLSIQEVAWVTRLMIPGVEPITTPKLQWMLKNNWRGEGMLKYQDWEFDVTQGSLTLDHKILKGLPDFSYDMHTRVGKLVCMRLTGRTPFKEWLALNGVEGENKKDSLGWALFLTEGGLLSPQVSSMSLSVLEHKFVAAKFSMTPFQWYEMVGMMSTALSSGEVNNLRERALDPLYP